MELTNIFLNKMEQLNKLSKRLGYYNFKDWSEKQFAVKKITPSEVEEIDLFHQMRNILAHGFSGRVIIYNDDINKLNYYLKLINKELGFEVQDTKLTSDNAINNYKNDTNKTGNGKKANKNEIVKYINSKLDNARKQGKSYIILRAGDLEKEVGLSQRIVSVCIAMYECMQNNDEVLSTTPSGYSTTITIKYYL